MFAAVFSRSARRLPEVPRPSADELFRDHASFVWRVVAAYGVRQADVQDVTQEVFIVAMRKLDEWDPQKGAITTWLHGIATRVAANHRRSAYVRRASQSTEVSDALPAHSGDPAEAADHAQLLVRLDAALETLDELKRQTFVLFEIAELSMHEVAATMNCPLKTAYKRLYAARREIAEHMRSLQPQARAEVTA